MRWLQTLLALSWTGLPAMTMGAALDQESYVRVGASVLRIEAPRVQGGFALGSGVAVASDKVVTNCHVTHDARAIHVLRGGLRFAASAQASDIEHDICLLDVPGLDAAAVPLGSGATLSVGQPLSALGYTGGLGLQNSPGEVLALHRFEGGHVIQTSSFFTSGASGGGLFDADGRLVGILTFRLRGGVGHYFSGPVEWVRGLLDGSSAVRFEPVGPAPAGPRRPYWQALSDALPRFLRAAVLLREDRWSDLEVLAADWVRDSPEDGEPWYLRGAALEHLGRLPEARDALECALQVDPGRTPALARLASMEQEPGPSPLRVPSDPVCR